MLQVSLLGEQVITDVATGAARPCPSRTVSLLALLAAHAGAPQQRQRIAGLFWPESGDAQALTNLRRELHHLRQLLDDDPAVVVTSRDLCWVDSTSCRVDVRVFETERRAAMRASEPARALGHAVKALEVYRGDLLPALYDDWLLDLRADLREQCVALCDLICRIGMQQGALAPALEAARRRITLQPLEEVGYRTLMELQVRHGDRAGAISTFHRCSSVLERELGVEPDRATRNLMRRLMAQDGSAGPGRRTDLEPASRSGLAAAQLVGRDHEFGLLRSFWQAAVQGDPRLVLVRGEAGVGKSRLVAELAALARRQGAAVAVAQCFGTAPRLALAPVGDWLRDPAVRTATAALEPLWRLEVDRLVPTGGTDHAAITEGTRAMVDGWQRHRFFEGLARALSGLGRPTLLVLDNLQWCDEETLSFIAFCLGFAQDSPLLMAATLRDDDEQQPELARWLHRMRPAGVLTEVSLGPLDETATGRLAEAVSGRPLPEGATALLQATTAGFPLYVVEAARASYDDGQLQHGDLAAVLRHRLDQTSPAARQVAALAAAVGRDFTLDLLTEASDLTSDLVVEAVDELWRRRLIRELPDGYDFTHDLLRAAAYGLVSPPQRWLLHRRLAQGFELLHPDQLDRVAVQLAEQYSRGGRPDRALPHYLRAAEVAAGRFAHAESNRLNRQALEIIRAMPTGPDRDARELNCLMTMTAPLNAEHGFSSSQLQEALERSLVLAERLCRPDLQLTTLVGLWASRFVQGRILDGRRIAAQAVAMVGPDDDLSSQAHFAYAGSSFSLGMPAEALEHFAVVRDRHGVVSLMVGSRLDVHGAAWAAQAHWLLGHEAEAITACADAVTLARSIEHPFSLAVALGFAAITHQLLGDRVGVAESAAELCDLCQRYSFAYYPEWGRILSGWARQDGQGLSLLQQGIDGLRAQGAFTRMPYWLALLADRLADANRPEAAAATLDAALSGGQARDDRWWLPEVMRIRAGFDPRAAAVDRLRAAAEMARSQGSVALLRRIEADLQLRGAPTVRSSVPLVN
ncbi:DNA-binding SARP family transcriptional activator/lambda repressor-like predicted transcriptional regulator [Microlunatus panaciterrae]|uniref:DNA-binding SARP family transcriptional activator/lambda repressor-like predicted transcriptional regulator n=1 Tax=Microlunatus panaciterrae TaxID=400768 RepID=A0ABS2RMG1_9ACTN|nr:AAA family ATPase [Microlunatus panaciterrae]MBM7799913.1 DNA-binding SARP family transcriptional activator/lambda repressor-like predicted transcriptional regulator [Microlunatus panaciterrae]